MFIFRTLFSCFLLVPLVLLNGCDEDLDDADVPTIVAILPNEGPVHKVVTIKGTNFERTSSFNNVVEFNGIPGAILSNTDSVIR